jgi:hypothetical protein
VVEVVCATAPGRMILGGRGAAPRQRGGPVTGRVLDPQVEALLARTAELGQPPFGLTP